MVYEMNTIMLADTSSEKDLGVMSANKASRLLGLIRATFKCLDKTTVPRLFKTMVRPHLEYGNVIWNTIFKRDKLEIEKIQRRATKLIAEIKHLSYE